MKTSNPRTIIIYTANFLKSRNRRSILLYYVSTSIKNVIVRQTHRHSDGRESEYLIRPALVDGKLGTATVTQQQR